MKDDWLAAYIEAYEYLARVAEASAHTAAEFAEAVAEISERTTTTCMTWEEAAAELAAAWAAALPRESDLQELADLAQEAEEKVCAARRDPTATAPGWAPQPAAAGEPALKNGEGNKTAAEIGVTAWQKENR